MENNIIKNNDLNDSYEESENERLSKNNKNYEDYI